MAKPKFGSPALVLHIGEEQWLRARKASSGGCLIADAIKSQYPHLTGISVDMATVRVSDRKEGKRYTYLTPAIAQHLLLSFDQGWKQPTEEVAIRRAVKIEPMTRGRGVDAAAAVAARRTERIQRAEEKLAAGEQLTLRQQQQLTKDRNAEQATPVERPSSHGPTEIERGVVHGGRPLRQGPAHPNLLRGRNRLFGAKVAAPSEAFQEAVDAAVAQRLAEREPAE